MTWLAGVPGSVTSGVLVAAIAAGARFLWHRRRVPTALSRRVLRTNYLRAVHAASRRPGVTQLDVLAPRLMPSADDKKIAEIQTDWEEVNHSGTVRVLTLDSDDCLQAGAELLDRDVEVRVAHRDLDSESLTLHVFETSQPADLMAIVNRHHHGVDKPGRINGFETVQPFRTHFENQWQMARPLESVLAEKILPRLGSASGKDAILSSFSQARAKLSIGTRTAEKILLHLAFRDNGRVIFIVGQPGAGKSYIRSKLASKLRAMRLEVQSLTDYPYAYLDLLRTLLRMNPAGRNGYKAYDGGAFVARDEATLAPALRALERTVTDSQQSYEVTLVEFARADLVAALQEFEAFRCRSQVIHVAAPAELRLARLHNRAVPPELTVADEAIVLSVSDNHLLPAPAQQTLYAIDGLEALKASPRWRNRIFEIDNGVDGDGNVGNVLDQFIQNVAIPYRSSLTSRQPQQMTLASVGSRQAC